MPISQNINEAGWFYHAPGKKRTDAPKRDAPAPSQIPGIGFDDPTLLEKEEVREMMFKESDSKYIQLAKMGGRKDLLSFNPDLYRKKQNEPSGYPRNEWFYLEDNRVEDEEKKKEESWDFLLPDYMVHKSYQPSFENPATPPVRGGAPYHLEKGSAMEGRAATDKTVKIPEVRRPGFGVRNEKPPATIKSLPRDKVIRSQEAQGDKRKGKPNPMQMPTETDEPTMMSKLLSGGYEKDWHEKRSEVTKRDGDSKAQNKKHMPVPSASYQNSNSQANKQTEEEKELFKLSRFKKISSKLDTRQDAMQGILAMGHQSSHPSKR